MLTQNNNAPTKKLKPTRTAHVGGISSFFWGKLSKPYPEPSFEVSKARFDIVE